MHRLAWPGTLVLLMAVLAPPALAAQEPGDVRNRQQHKPAQPATEDSEAADTAHQAQPRDAHGLHEMWMRPVGRSWQLLGMAQGYPILTMGAPARSELPINRTDVHFTQPAIMANLERHDARVVLRTTLNFEGLTQPDGEITFGAWGEGFLDSRHPHTFLHEAMLSLNLWTVGGGAFSLSAGRGFAPYGTDDPMARPVQKYPTNHHLSQLLERWTVNAVYLRERWSLEGGLFAGNEPTGPWDAGNIEGFGRSWSARVSRWFGEGAAPIAPWEISGSYARVREFHDGHDALTVLYNVAARHARNLRGSTVYALGEFSVGDAERTGRDFALLGESQVRRGAHQPYIRVEYATRPEYQRQGPPGTDSFFRYDHDDAAIGATRWLITSLGYGHQLSGYPASARPFLEVQHHRVRPERGGIQPADLFDSSSFWSVSVGLRLFFGGEPMRMGRYGVFDPMTMMHRQREPAHHHPPGHH